MRLWTRPRAAFQLERRSSAWWAAATVVVALILLLLQSLLYLPDGTGIESFLGELGENAARQLASWGASHRLPFAGLYLAADTLLFVPAYAAFGLALARAVRDHSQVPQQRSPWWRALEAPLLVLVLVDLAENALGLARLGPAGSMTAVGVTSLSALGLARLPDLRASVGAASWMRYALVGAAAVALLASAPWGLSSPASGPFTRIAVGAHQAKGLLAPLVFGELALAGLSWLFGVDRLLARAFGEVDSERAHQAARERANLRGVIWDLLGRSRYVILTLALIGVLVAGMDQARDVLYAMASSAFREGPDGWNATLGSLAALIALASSTAGLEYSCWLWTRSVGQIQPARLEPATSPPGAALPVENAPQRSPGPLHSLADGFAKYWARALAFVPIVLFVGLHARVVRDGVMSGVDGLPPRMAPVFVVLAAGAALIGFGVWLLWRHGDPKYSQAGCYYSALTWREWASSIGLFTEKERPKLKYRMLCGHVRVYWLPLLLGAGLLLCRIVDVFPPHWWLWQADYIPSLSLAVVQCSLALWLCLFGWLSVLETRQTIPWLGLLVALVGALGFLGLTDNHVIWPALAPDRPLPAPTLEEWASLRMLGFTCLLLVLLLSAYALAIWAARRRSREQPAFWRALCGALALCGLAALVLAAANAWATSRAPASGSEVLRASQRPTLDQALARWLKTFCPDGGSCPDEDAFPVYFVSTEGGGIRAAAWTAFTLDALAANPQFLARTFSISGVSGGAVGAAAFRACSVERGEPSGSAARWACLQHFAATDLLSPLLSAWMFEDVLARVLPTRWCSVPGCGVLSRGAWFEQALELAAPGLRRGLFESSGWRSPTPHVPYLLLNATWVESGDRAIASDLSVTRAAFPDARDQLTLLGTDLPLATAAHNAARFPFINPIGSLHTNSAMCAPGANAAESAVGHAPCGHVADGGYFDNSGAQSTLDVVNALGACLSDPGDSDHDAYPACRALGAGRRLWLREHLMPEILMLRNDVDPEYNSGENYAPEQALEPAANRLFSDALGPALTLFHVSGIGASRRLAEARQSNAVRALRERWRSAVGSAAPAARSLDLLPDGTLYPLGWHLSRAAIDGMRSQAARLTLP